MCTRGSVRTWSGVVGNIYNHGVCVRDVGYMRGRGVCTWSGVVGNMRGWGVRTWSGVVWNMRGWGLRTCVEWGCGGWVYAHGVGLWET